MSCPSNSQLREAFPDWSGRERSLYLAGVRAVQAGSFDPEADHDPFFLRGAADATGPDAETEDWFQAIADDHWVDHNWWEK